MATLSKNYAMVIFPFKKPYELDITNQIYQHVTRKYKFNLNNSLALNQLRNSALFRTSGHEKLIKLIKYYDQLTSMQSKFHISDDYIPLEFKWKDAFDGGIFGHSLSFSSILYERICVSFNIGASCSEIAAEESLDQDDGLKTAAKLYQQAAGFFQFIRDSSFAGTDCTSDLCPETINLFVLIMLAQAQEIFCLKAIKDKSGDMIVSKLASQCSDYYADAIKPITFHDSLKKLQKNVMSCKKAFYEGMAEYYRAKYEYNEKNIGECLARFIKSIENLDISEKLDVKSFKIKDQILMVKNEYDQIKKENDLIYHENIADYKTLEAIERASLVKITNIKFPLSQDFQDLFADLIPLRKNKNESSISFFIFLLLISLVYYYFYY